MADEATARRRPVRRPDVGRQVRRWRLDRALTLSQLAGRSGLNLGFLSQIENEKATPSLDSLAAVAEALDVPVAWLFIDEARAPLVVRASDRRVRSGPGGTRIERVDGGLSRDISIVQACTGPGSRTGSHAHLGDEHHVVLAGHWRLTQGDHVIDAGPGDYIVWDATIPHDAENVGDDEGAMLIVSLRGSAHHARGEDESPR